MRLARPLSTAVVSAFPIRQPLFAPPQWLLDRESAGHRSEGQWISRPGSNLRILFRAEVGTITPPWTPEGHPIPLRTYGLPRELRNELFSWTEEASARHDDDIDARGRALLAGLQKDLGPLYAIEWGRAEETTS